jgi:hypothetical protein
VLVFEAEEEPDTVDVLNIVPEINPEAVNVLEPVLVLETEILPECVGLADIDFDICAD